MLWLKTFLVGFLIGLANLIPGVSGGTFALILGVYERIIGFLNNIDTVSIITVLRQTAGWVTGGCRREQGRRLWHDLTDRDYPFIVILGTGSLTCILALSAMMKYLLTHHFTATYGYFFGLIILSVLIPYRMLKSLTPLMLVPLVIGIVLTIGVAASVNPYDKTFAKSELLKSQYVDQQGVHGGQADIGQADRPLITSRFQYVGKYSFGDYLYIFFCGIVAISAMVLPGISGSLVLILMNQYFAVISAIANIRNLLLDDLLFLAAMVGGIAIGLVTFSRFIDFAFRRFHDIMISFLIGLIAGSLYALWPFKKALVIANYYVKEGAVIQRLDNFVVYSNINILPKDWTTALTALAAVAAGIVTMLFFLKQQEG